MPETRTKPSRAALRGLLLTAFALSACTDGASNDPTSGGADAAASADAREAKDAGPMFEQTEKPRTVVGGKDSADGGAAGAAGRASKPRSRDAGSAAPDAAVAPEQDGGSSVDAVPEPPGRDQATGLVGTWKGMLRSQNDSQDFVVTISAAGNYVFPYTNQSGQTRQVEFTTVGQTVSWIPSGGGVLTVTVDSIAPRSGGLRITWHGRFEKNSQGNLDQEDLSIVLDLMLDAGMLRTRQTVQDVQFLNGMKLAESTTTREGSLQRQSSREHR